MDRGDNMLLELSITNFALINSLKIDFHKGLNILTGETGAGKSIIIDALGLVLGQRASRDSIRKGQEKTIVEALFQISPKNKLQVKELLNKNGISTEDDSSIIMTREVFITGRSSCRINGRLVTLSLMKQLSRLLIDIHGQHEHQSLLHWEKHIDLLDSYGNKNITRLIQITKNYYRQYRDYKLALEDLIKDEKELEREKDILKFQLEEINEGKLNNIDEDQQLEKRRDLLIHSEKLFQNSKKAYKFLYSGTDMQASVYDQLSKILSCIEEITSVDSTMKPVLEQIRSSFIQIEDAGFVLRDYSDNLEFDPKELDQIEKRLNSINNLKRKYGESIKEIAEYKETLELKLSKIENKDYEVEALRDEIKRKWQSYIEVANDLSQKRKDIALQLEKNIIKELQDLGMNKVQFKINIKTSQEYANGNGIDRVEFLISPNLGEELRPLAKIASGGELARIMLALKSILADVDNIDSLIFDEIDTGISGRTAQIVAEKMSLLSRTYQIICITHLPQIASMADAHYLIEKQTNENKTITNIYPLNNMGKVKELARMLGGATLTKLTLNHAQEMLEMAKKIKKNFQK